MHTWLAVEAVHGTRRCIKSTYVCVTHLYIGIGPYKVGLHVGNKINFI